VTTLTKHCTAIRAIPVDQIDTKAVLTVLGPIWAETPETAARLRGRIEAVLNRARALGLIDVDRANPARWRGHLDQVPPNPKKLRNNRRGHHAAMPCDDVPAFMGRLKAAPGEAAKALAFAILTAARSGEVFGATWDEIDIGARVWTVPGARMKMEKEHRVPLSDASLLILRGQFESRGESPTCSPALALSGRSASPRWR
jgi:integrase